MISESAHRMAAANGESDAVGMTKMELLTMHALVGAFTIANKETFVTKGAAGAITMIADIAVAVADETLYRLAQVKLGEEKVR